MRSLSSCGSSFIRSYVHQTSDCVRTKQRQSYSTSAHCRLTLQSRGKHRQAGVCLSSQTLGVRNSFASCKSSPESNASQCQGCSRALAAPGCPSFGGQRTAVPPPPGAMPRWVQRKSSVSFAWPHAVSSVNSSPPPAPAGLGVASQFVLPLLAPTRRPSGLPPAAAQLIRYASGEITA